MRRRLTVEVLRRVKPEAGERIEVYDTVEPGLHLRCSPGPGSTTRRSWFIVYRYPATREGRQRRMKLGEYGSGEGKLSIQEARDRAAAVKKQVSAGVDPMAERQERRDDATVRELFNDCLERHWKRETRTWADIERLLAGTPAEKSKRKDRARGVIPASWWKRPAKSITPRDVIELLDGIVDRGNPYQANKVRAYLSKMFRHGVPRGLVDTNPVRDVPLPKSPRVREAEPLAAEKIRKLWSVLTRAHPVIAAFYRLRLLTLQRGRQVRLMRWADLEHNDDGTVGEWWTAPGASTKNAESDRVYLNTLARREIERLQPLTGDSEYVLRSPRKKKDEPLGRLQKASQRLREKAKLPHDWARDFRLTGASWLTEHGTDPDTADRVLGHQPRGRTGVAHHYDRYAYDKEKREALTMWGERVAEILLRKRPERAKVVPIRSKGGAAE